MLIKDAYKATRILETFSNYSISDNLHMAEATVPADSSSDTDQIYADEMFWNMILKNPEAHWNKKFNLYSCGVSEWVARVPGLFWAKGSEAIRKLSDTEVVKKMPGHIEYTPPGKSGKVLGGVGTLRLLPDDEGNALYTLTFSGNSSAGIPALITQEVLDALKIRQGDVLNIKSAKWVKMTLNWAKQFESTRAVPRGYLRIDSPEDIKVLKNNAHIEYQPFSVMEYQSKNALLFDYVFFTTVSTTKEYRKRIITFFENYRKKENRNGQYLFSCDMANPIFESRYNTPSEMRLDYENSQMEILERRVRKEYFNDLTITRIAELIPSLYKTAGAIRTLAGLLELPVANLADSSAAKMSVQLLDICIDNNKVEALLDRIVLENPSALNT